MNYRQLLDYKLANLEDEIVWGKDRKNLIKSRMQEKIIKKNKKNILILNWEWLKVSFSLVFVGVLCFVLVNSVFDKKMDFLGFKNADSSNYLWHNLEVKPILPPEDIKWADFESYLTSVKLNKNFDLKEAQKLASFKILRTNFNLDLPLVFSKGVVIYPASLPMEKFKGPITYWDIWQKDDKWVFTKQYLDENSKLLLTTKKENVTWKVRPHAKVIINNNEAIAVLMNEGEDGVWINMKLKKGKAKVIDVQIRGNISEEKLINLAKSYLE